MVQDVRLIDSPWEWTSLANLSPSVYVDRAWTMQSVDRIRRIARGVITGSLLRVWVDDSLIVCPVVRVDCRWFNTPRSWPVVVSGPPLDPAAELLEAVQTRRDLECLAELKLTDDSKQVAKIRAEAEKMTAASTSIVTRKALIRSDIETIRDTIRWRPGEYLDWLATINCLWRVGTWSVRMHIHLVDGQAIGYTFWAEKNDETDCLAVLPVGRVVPVFASQR